MAVCTVLLIAAGFAIAALLHSGRPIPRHAFILDMVDRLSQSAVEQESTTQFRHDVAA